MPTRVVHLPLDDPELLAGLDRIRDELHVPRAFAADVLAAAKAAAASPRERRDLRDLELVTVDPAGSRDLDQAFAAERRGDGYRVHYAIADVAAFVPDDGPVDVEAHRRGMTVYLPDARAGLYPPEIAEGSASLLPEQERPALCWTIELDGDGTPTAWHLEAATVRSRRAWSYAEVQAAIGDGSAPEPFGLLRAIGTLRQDAERARGGVSLALPAQELRRTDASYTLGFDEPRPVEGWNAQISLLTGMCAATTMVDGGVGILRTLPPPDDHAVGRLRATARALSLAWPEHVSYPDLVASLDPQDPDHVAFLEQAAQTLRGAGYHVLDGTERPAPVHGAIAAHYAHVTAPLRRLADRYANAVLLELSADREPSDDLRAALAPLPEIMGDAGRRVHQVERAVVDLAEAIALQGSEGDVFHGVVVDVEQETARVLIRRPPIVASLDADGASLGDEITVRVVRVDAGSRQIELARA